MTEKIANLKPKKLLAVEKDKKLSSILEEMFKNSHNVKIINKNNENDRINVREKVTYLIEKLEKFDLT